MKEAVDMELIEQHYEGKLSGAALVNFEERLKNDANFAKEVKLYQQLMRGIEVHGTATFLKKVASWEEEAKKESQPSGVTLFRKRMIRLVVAAAILLILLIPLGQYLLFNEPNATVLFSEYFTPYPNVVTDRGEDTTPLEKGLIFYSAKNYDKAIESLTEFINTSDEVQQKETARFYLGVAYLANQNGKAAQEVFQQLPQNSSRFSEQIEWFTALTYVQQSDFEAAKAVLIKIKTNETHSFKAKAEQLLESL